MIIITIQIQTAKSGVSQTTTIDSREANAGEDQVAQVMDAAIRAAMEYMLQNAKAGNSVSGGVAITDLVKQRLENLGLNWDKSELAKAVKKKVKRK